MGSRITQLIVQGIVSIAAIAAAWIGVIRDGVSPDTALAITLVTLGLVYQTTVTLPPRTPPGA
ncbi:MAG TPA: hypothetical protein VFA66_10195 [Gaiellaceae bacterium]|nr:hypothetical protein [Gaiellaceae bacterium]